MPASDRCLSFCSPSLALYYWPAAAQTSIKKVTSVEGITEYRLDNGLRVLLFPDPTKENITVNVTYHMAPRTVFLGWAIGGPENLNNIEQGFKEELQRVLDKGFTDEEVQNGISGILQSGRVQRADDEQLAQILQRLMFYNETLAHLKQFYAELADSSAKDVVKAMKQYFSPDDMLYIKAGDMSKAAEQPPAANAR